MALLRNKYGFKLRRKDNNTIIYNIEYDLIERNFIKYKDIITTHEECYIARSARFIDIVFIYTKNNIITSYLKNKDVIPYEWGYIDIRLSSIFIERFNLYLIENTTSVNGSVNGFFVVLIYLRT